MNSFGAEKWISNDLIGNQTRDLPACNIVPQPTTLPHAPHIHCTLQILYFFWYVEAHLKGSDLKNGGKSEVALKIMLQGIM
jgi:hypothetical protein